MPYYSAIASHNQIITYDKIRKRGQKLMYNIYIYNYYFRWPLSVFGGHTYPGSIYKIPGTIYKIPGTIFKIPGAIYCSISGTIYKIPGAIYCSISGTMYKIPGTIDRLGRKSFQNPRNCL